MSTLKVNTLEPRSSTTITVPTGNVFTIADNSGISIGGTVVSATAAQLNVMATVTASATEINVLDGIPAGLTSTELGYSDGVTSGIQAQIDTKAVLTAVQTYTAGQRGEITALTSANTITIDMADSNHFSVTLDHNATFANPTNLTAGQTGSIFITQGSTGGTGSWDTYWDWAAGTAPTLTTTAAAVDRIDYVVRSATSINAVATLNLS